MMHHYLAARQELTAPGSPFAVSEIVVRDVPIKVFASAPPNMRSVWEMTAPHADKDYIVYEDEHYSAQGSTRDDITRRPTRHQAVAARRARRPSTRTRPQIDTHSEY